MLQLPSCDDATTSMLFKSRTSASSESESCDVAVGDGNDELELSVRVLDGGALRGDKLLGEARVPLAGAGVGAATFRLLGGGYASLSLRWAVEPSSAAGLQSPTAIPANAVAGQAAELQARGQSETQLKLARVDEDPVTAMVTGVLGRSGGGATGDVVTDSTSVGGESPQTDASGAAETPAAVANPFEEALAFWAERALGSPACDAAAVASAAHALADVLLTEPAVHSCDSEGLPETSGSSTPTVPGDAVVDELLLQAPLAELLSHLGRGSPNRPPTASQGVSMTESRVGGGAEASESAAANAAIELLAAVSDRLWRRRLSPLASSRLAGALVEQLARAPGASNSGASDRRAEEALLCQLLLAAGGSGLVELKRLIDAAGGGRDLRYVVFTAVSNSGAREALLTHFLDEAKRLPPPRPAHVLSDIDMTVWVGKFGTGGPKLPQGPIPGALPLFHALGSHVTFLSARPPLWESQTRRLLVDDVGIAEAVVLPGSLRAVAQALLQPEQARRAMGERKTAVFGEFAQLHPEARFIFVGDSGEGDVDFATSFMAMPELDEAHCHQLDEPAGESSSFGSSSSSSFRHLPRDRRDRAALIHDVAQADGIRPKTPGVRRAELRKDGIFIFDTYAGAALELYRLGFLGAEGLRSAVQGCLEEFGELAPEDFFSFEVFEARRDELMRDLQDVNAVLRKDAGVKEKRTLNRTVTGDLPPKRISEFLRLDSGGLDALKGLESVQVPAEAGNAGGAADAPAQTSSSTSIPAAAAGPATATPAAAFVASNSVAYSLAPGGDSSAPHPDVSTCPSGKTAGAATDSFAPPLLPG